MKTYTSTMNNTLLTASSLLIAVLFGGQVEAKAMKADFNGDKVEGMVVGVPREDIGNIIDAVAIPP